MMSLLRANHHADLPLSAAEPFCLSSCLQAVSAKCPDGSALIETLSISGLVIWRTSLVRQLGKLAYEKRGHCAIYIQLLECQALPHSDEVHFGTLWHP